MFPKYLPQALDRVQSAGHNSFPSTLLSFISLLREFSPHSSRKCSHIIFPRNFYAPRSALPFYAGCLCSQNFTINSVMPTPIIPIKISYCHKEKRVNLHFAQPSFPSNQQNPHICTNKFVSPGSEEMAVQKADAYFLSN